MGRYTVAFGNREYEVSVNADGGVFTADGAEVDVNQLDRATFSVLLNGRSYKIAAQKKTSGYHVQVNGKTLEIKVESERERLLRQYQLQSHTVSQRLEIHAPMPALVVRIGVSVGDEVVQDQGLITLEAMKMENEIKAHQPGKVKEIYVLAGKAVEKGELLMLLE